MRTNGAKPKRRVRQYTPVERLGYMTLALQTSSEEVARQHGISPQVIRHWFEEAGGLREARRWLEEEMLGAYLRSRQAIFAEVVKRADKLSEDALMETYRKLAVPAETPLGANAVAMAKSEVHVHLDDSGS